MVLRWREAALLGEASVIKSLNPQWQDLSREEELAPERGIPRAAATRGNDESAKRV